MSPLRLVVTGTWGTGKTAILGRLHGSFDVVPEPARILLSDDPSLEGDWARFSRALLDRSLSDHAAMADRSRVFDRGLPDCLAYARWFELDTRPFQDAALSCRYHEEVLMFPAWEEIYTNDDLRKAPFEMAADFEEVLARTYVDLEYQLVEVPRDTVVRREDFVSRFIAERVPV